MKNLQPVRTILGWIAIAFGALGALGSLFIGDGAGAKLGGVLIGAAFVVLGVWLVGRINWKAAVPGAVVTLLAGGALSPSPEPSPVVAPAPTSVVSTSMWRPTTSSNAPSSTTSRPPSSTTTTTTTTTMVPTTTTTTAQSVPGFAETDTRTPVPVPLVPQVPPTRTTTVDSGGGSGSGSSGSGGTGGRSGARMCKDGTWSTAGRGACSGHGGLAR